MTKLVWTAFLAALVRLSVCATSCPSPDGTDAMYYWKDCGNGLPIVVNNITLTNTANKVMYPIDITQGVILHVDSVNNGQLTYNSLVEAVDVYVWAQLFGKCDWHKLTVLGPVQQRDCANCPLKPGPLTLDYPVDFSGWAAILKALGAGDVIKIAVTLKNGDNSVHENIGCIIVEGKLAKV